MGEKCKSKKERDGNTIAEQEWDTKILRSLFTRMLI